MRRRRYHCVDSRFVDEFVVLCPVETVLLHSVDSCFVDELVVLVEVLYLLFAHMPRDVHQFRLVFDMVILVQ